MDLTLVLHNVAGQGVMWCGVSGRQLGKLPQNESMDIPLTLLAVTSGLQVSLPASSCLPSWLCRSHLSVTLLLYLPVGSSLCVFVAGCFCLIVKADR